MILVSSSLGPEGVSEESMYGMVSSTGREQNINRQGKVRRFTRLIEMLSEHKHTYHIHTAGRSLCHVILYPSYTKPLSNGIKLHHDMEVMNDPVD